MFSLTRSDTGWFRQFGFFLLGVFVPDVGAGMGSGI